MAAPLIKEGYLLKKNTGILKNWQRRWFVLDSATLTFYKNHSDVGIKFSKQVRVEEVLEVLSAAVSPAHGASCRAQLIWCGTVRVG